MYSFLEGAIIYIKLIGSTHLSNKFVQIKIKIDNTPG